MPSFPQPGSVTICEINRELIAGESLSDERARETYGKLLGAVFSPVPFQADQLASFPNLEQEAEEQGRGDGESVGRKILGKAFQGFVNMFQPNYVNLLPEVGLHGVSWHQHKHIIAFVSGQNQVTICDYEDSEGKDCILSSESQRDVKVLEWRPNGGKSLAVACKGGICIWSASYPGNAAVGRSGITSYLATVSGGSGYQWALVDFLRSSNSEQITALSWSPDGRYLASASYESSAFTIWDVAQGSGTPIRRGLGSISMLKWSPSGDSFFSAKFDGTFYLWETNSWTSEQWSSSSGFVTGAQWDRDGRIVLLAFSGSLTLGSVHFASKPPSLDAHLLPVELPEIMSLTGSCGIDKVAWDASCERLAVSYKGGDEAYNGLIAIFDTRRTPLISASIIGFLRGPGENPRPLAFAFHNKFKQGPLLSVCWSSGFCCTYPLIFHS